MVYDVAVVGAGFFGSEIALKWAEQGASVILLDRHKEAFGEASRWNQARVHGGYHYPRHLATALSSARNLPRFLKDFPSAVLDQVPHLYAIPRRHSKVSATKFHRLMELIGNPLKEVSVSEESWLPAHSFEAVFEVREPLFDWREVRRILAEKIFASPRLHLRMGHEILWAHHHNGLWQLDSRTGGTVNCRKVFNCTYANLDTLQMRAGLEPTPLTRELAEICLVQVPTEIQNRALTVMCGPFFSLLPWPERPELHSFSHVRWTPHTESQSPLPDTLLPPSNFEFMKRDASHLIPCLKKLKWVESFYATKAILPQASRSDGRPILLQEQARGSWWNVLGGKLDNIYDVLEAIP